MWTIELKKGEFGLISEMLHAIGKMPHLNSFILYVSNFNQHKPISIQQNIEFMCPWNEWRKKRNKIRGKKKSKGSKATKEMNMNRKKATKNTQTLLDIGICLFSLCCFTYNEQQKSKHKINEYVTQSENKTANQNKIKWNEKQSRNKLHISELLRLMLTQSESAVLYQTMSKYYMAKIAGQKKTEEQHTSASHIKRKDGTFIWHHWNTHAFASRHRCTQ